VKPQAALAAPAQKRERNPSLPAGELLQAIARGLARAMETARVYIDHHRSARTAEELYRHLSLMSDAELARRGLRRDQIAQYVKQGF
jgi:hypothetical protein